MADFYDEMDIGSIDAVKERHGGAFVPGDVDLESCVVDSEGLLTDYEIKRQRLQGSYAVAKQNANNNRRKMTLVNRVL